MPWVNLVFPVLTDHSGYDKFQATVNFHIGRQKCAKAGLVTQNKSFILGGCQDRFGRDWDCALTANFG